MDTSQFDRYKKKIDDLRKKSSRKPVLGGSKSLLQPRRSAAANAVPCVKGSVAVSGQPFAAYASLPECRHIEPFDISPFDDTAVGKFDIVDTAVPEEMHTLDLFGFDGIPVKKIDCAGIRGGSDGNKKEKSQD